MPLTLITGPANAGKTGRVYARLREAIDAGSEAELLLPSAPDVERARAEFARTHPLGLRIEQFDRYLAQRWLFEGDGRRLVTARQRDALAAAALRGSAGETLRPLVGRRGVVDLVSRLACRSARPGARQRTGRLRGEAAEIVGVIDRYRLLLGWHGLVEPAEAFSLLAPVPTSHGRVLAAHRFADLAEHQLAYLRRAADAGVEVIVTLTWERGAPGSRAADALVVGLAPDTHEILSAPTEGSDPADLRMLADRLYRPPAAPLPPPTAVSFVMCADLEDEIERCAEEASAAVRAGVPPERVAVLCGDPSPLAAAVARALADRGLACDVDAEEPLRGLPLARAAEHALRFAVAGDRGDLLAWLRSPYAPVQLETVHGLDARWRRSREERPRVLVAAVRGVSKEAGRSLSRARRLASQPVDGEWANEWTRFIQDLLAPTLPEDASVLPASATEEDAAAARALCSLGAEAAAVLGAPLRADDILAAIASARIGPGLTERRGCVQVSSVRRARSRRFDVVVLTGLTEAEPGGGGAEDPLRVGAVGAAARALGAIADDLGEERERAEGLAAVTRARRRLVLLTHSIGADGQPRSPSVLWSEALDLYRAGEADADELPAFVETPVRHARPPTAPLRRFARRLTECEGDAAVALASREVFSAGELESYLGCPARWLRDRWLRPQRPDAEFAALESGRLVHHVLRVVFERLPEETGWARVTSENVPLAVRIASEAFSEAAARMPEPAGLEECDRLDAAWAQLEAFLTREPSFAPRLVPEGLEVTFGSAGGDDGVDLGDLRLRGRIDRVDADAEGRALVIDYKSGLIPSFGEFEKRGLLQLQLYVEVLRRSGRAVSGAVYRSLRTGALSGFYLEEAFDPDELPGAKALGADEFDSVLGRALERAREAAGGIRSARVSPRPSPHVCRHCPMLPGCERGAA